MNIYVDTGAFFALADGADTHYRAADEYTRRMEDQNHFVTSSYVFVESWLLIRNKLGYSEALAFLARVRRSVQIFEVSTSDIATATKILAAWPDQQFSLVDAVSFALMERMKLDTAFSFDAHFRVYRYGAKRERSFKVVP